MSNLSKFSLAVVVIALLVVGALFRSKQAASSVQTIPIQKNSPLLKAEPPARKDDINIIASAGLWLARHGDELQVVQDDLAVVVDDHGNVYNDDRDGKSGKIIAMEGPSFKEQMPGYFLIIEKMDRDEWEELVNNHPDDRHVQVVNALCKKQLPVAVFIEKGLINAENVAYGDPCAAFNVKRVDRVLQEPHDTIPTNSGVARIPVLHHFANDQSLSAYSIIANCEALENFQTKARLVENSPPFTITPYKCSAGTFLVVTSLSPLCSISLDEMTIKSMTKNRADNREHVQIEGILKSNAVKFDVGAHYSTIDVASEDSSLPSNSTERCSK